MQWWLTIFCQLLRRKIPASMASSTTAPSVPDSSLEPLPNLATGAMVAFCAAKLLVHVFTSLHIKVVNFVAEVAVVPLARHLDWGYVDAAPLVALYARAALLLGGSLTAVRILPALAGTFGRIGFYANSPRSFEPTLPRYRDPQLGSHRF